MVPSNMCNVICVNMKCCHRLPTGYCGRAYPCSECQTLYNESDPLAEFNQKIIADYRANGYNVTQVHDEITVTIPYK